MKKAFVCSMFAVVSLSAGSLFAAPLSNMEKLGKHLYQDKDLSLNSTQSCATCHHQTAGFADPKNVRDPFNSFVSLGDDGFSKGGRNAPSAAYCGFSPILHRAGSGEWFGGMFWDGRKTGENLGDPLAEQAQGPPLNPVEMNMPDLEAVIDRIEMSNYANLFMNVFGSDVFTDPATAYDLMAKAIAAYERSVEISPFSSRYDRNELSGRERRGLRLVEQNCIQCHSMDQPAGAPGPLFTSYGYANIGVPVNEALLDVPGTVYAPPDRGLGGVDSLNDESQWGKFKIPTLRNIAVTAPYSHNGVFPTLLDMVSFHNSRDGWPAPEVGENISALVGNMGLNGDELDDIVAFLHALTDQAGNI